MYVVSELPILHSVETKRENSAPVPFIFDIHNNEPSTSIIKSRSIDAEFSHNFQQHQKIGTRSVSILFLILIDIFKYYCTISLRLIIDYTVACR